MSTLQELSADTELVDQQISDQRFRGGESTNDAFKDVLGGGTNPMQGMIQQVLNDPRLDRLLWTVAEREARQSEALAAVVEVSDVDAEVEIIDPQERYQTLRAAVEATLTREFVAWWWETLADEYIDNPDKAQHYIALSPEEWHDSIRTWYEALNEQGAVSTPLEEAGPSQIGHVADQYTRLVFDLPLSEFLVVVVNWSAERAIEDLLAGPSDQTTAVLEQLRSQLDDA